MNPSAILNIKKEQVIELDSIIRELKTNKKEKMQLTSGSKYIDTILGGGFHPGKIFLVLERIKQEKPNYVINYVFNLMWKEKNEKVQKIHE